MHATIDVETRNKVPIAAGASKYAHTAELMCLSYKIGEAKVKSWRPGEPLPTDLFEHVKNGGEVHAHNATFEINIWEKVLVAKHGFPAMPLENWRCTMAECYAAGLLGSLNNAAEALGLDVRKDMSGRRLMLKMAKPRKPTKHNKAIWHEEPDQIQALRDYCDQDVVSEIAVSNSIQRLSKREQQIFLFDQRVNQRGIKIDRELAESAVYLWDEHCRRLDAELSSITFGGVNSANEVNAATELIKSLGLPIPDLTKGTVANFLDRMKQPSTIRRILEIRQMSAMSSIKKYHKMLLCAENDDRIRGCSQYYGAHTGRWAGRLTQFQNLPRGSISSKDDIEWLVELVKRRDLDAIQLASPLPLGDLLSSLLRSCIIPEDDKRLLVCDFASVEARGLAWVSDEEWLLQAFVDGADPYVLMASDIYGIDPQDVSKDQRFYGKTAVLGCFAEDTLVLTDSGWKQIIEVAQEDRLWDGVEFVDHEGALYQGVKQVFTHRKVSATSDHLCLTTSGWMPWEVVATDTQSIKAATELAGLPYWATDRRFRSAAKSHSLATSSDATAALYSSRIEVTSTKRGQHSATLAGVVQAVKNSITSTHRRCLTQCIEKGCWTDSLPRSPVAIRKPVLPTNIMVLVAYLCILSGEMIGRLSSCMYKLFQGGTTLIWRSTESTTTETMNRGTSDSLHGPRTRLTNGTSLTCKIGSKSWKPVYDIVNCGPRNRFTILTSEGPIVVHNCGYMLGARGLQSNLKNMFSIDKPLPFCEEIVKGYRRKNADIKSFWYSLGSASMKTVDSGQPHRAGPIVMHIKGDWLCMRLPSGRDVRYYKPEIVSGDYGPQIEYTSVNERGLPYRARTYAGKLTENAIQAICRDLLVESMSKLERLGYKVVFHVHDEVVLEVDDGFGSISEVEKVMCEVPDWAEGFPIGAEGFECKRYRK